MAQKLALDSRDSAGNTRIMWRQKSDRWQQKQTGVQFFAAVSAYKTTKLGVEAIFADVAVYIGAQFAPVCYWTR